MKAQKIYDFVNDGGCSGVDAHEFFDDVLGEMSPSGHAEIPDSAGKALMSNSLYAQAHNSPSLKDWCSQMAKKFNATVRRVA